MTAPHLTETPEFRRFIEALEETPRAWKLLDDGRIEQQSIHGRDWTLGVALLHLAHDEGAYFFVATLLDDRATRATIYDANDNAPGHDPRIRAALLAACGLS